MKTNFGGLLCCGILAANLAFGSAESRSEIWLGRNEYFGDVERADISNLAKERWFLNQVDHFSQSNQEFFEQRYFIFDKYWGGDGYPVLFYTGNEADVSLYVHASGLMWENAEDLKACLIFAEHRYYGKSQIHSNQDLLYLTHDQALADFATLLYSFQKNESAYNSPIISFGGSYGGMLTAWFRFKYPSLITGAIAASAPIFAFEGQGLPFFENGGNNYWKIVSDTAGPSCAAKSRSGFKDLLSRRPEELTSMFRLCDTPRSSLDVALWIANSFDTMAMGEFPFRSNYLTGDPNVFLPPFPVRAACGAMERSQENAASATLLHAASLFYNASGKEKCFKVPSTTEAGDDRFSGELWTMQWCSEAMPEEFYFTMTGQSDMFFPYNDPYSRIEIEQRCKTVYNTTRRSMRIRELYGSAQSFLNSASNIVFSNGKFDPWRAGGVTSLTAEQEKNGLHVILIENGAHHVDLMFSNSGDTPDITAARQQELSIIRSWISSYRSNH